MCVVLPRWSAEKYEFDGVAVERLYYAIGQAARLADGIDMIQASASVEPLISCFPPESSPLARELRSLLVLVHNESDAMRMLMQPFDDRTCV